MKNLNKNNLSKIKNNNKQLTMTLKKSSGRNNSGKITVYHKGGGNKKKYKNVSFNEIPGTSMVTNIEYDSNRTSFIAKSYCFNNSKYYYTLASKNLKVLDIINSDNKVLNVESNRYTLDKFNIGDNIYNIELKPGCGGVLVRSAGTKATLLNKNQEFATVLLPSGEQRFIHLNCKASSGIVSNQNHWNVDVLKAGKSRALNKRPTVRGVAMNPIDHPHGGGEGKTSGGRPSVTPWGRYTKGQPTRSKKKNNKFIYRTRKNKKLVK